MICHLLGFAMHPEITQSAADLFANETPDDDAEELETDLLRVEAEFGDEELWDFYGEEHTAEAKDHGICNRGDQDGGILEETERLDEFVHFEGFGVETAKGEVFLLERRSDVLDSFANIQSFRLEEESEEELDAVDDGEHAVDPSVVSCLGHHETHDEWSERWT